MKEIRTAYTWLGISEDATEDEIKKAWKKIAKKCHPDAGGNVDEFQKMRACYDCLIDPVKRSEYDLKVKRIRRKEKIRSSSAKIFDSVSSFFHSEVASQKAEQAQREQVRRNREASPQADYYRQQEEAENEWRREYERTMNAYYDTDGFTQGLEQALHSTDELLYSILSDGIVRMGKQKIEKDPFSVSLEPEIKVEGRAEEVMQDLRDSILKAEQMVRIFNKYTGGV
jgi:curved DNA-binding protein CbpA